MHCRRDHFCRCPACKPGAIVRSYQTLPSRRDTDLLRVKVAGIAMGLGAFVAVIGRACS